VIPKHPLLGVGLDEDEGNRIAAHQGKSLDAL